MGQIMYLKLTLAILVFSLVGCASTSKTTNKVQLKESAVRTLLDGTWIVKQTENTPIRKGLPRSKYYEYYSALHAHSIGCKSYSQIQLKVGKNEKAYKCVVNGTYLTEKSLAVGTAWQ